MFPLKSDGYDRHKTYNVLKGIINLKLVNKQRYPKTFMNNTRR